MSEGQCRDLEVVDVLWEAILYTKEHVVPLELVPDTHAMSE